MDTVYISYENFMILTSGTNPAALEAAIEEMQEGKNYIMESDNANFRIILGEDGNLQIGEQIL